MRAGRIPEHFQVYMSVKEAGLVTGVLRDVLQDEQFKDELSEDEIGAIEELLEGLSEEADDEDEDDDEGEDLEEARR